MAGSTDRPEAKRLNTTELVVCGWFLRNNEPEIRRLLHEHVMNVLSVQELLKQLKKLIRVWKTKDLQGTMFAILDTAPFSHLEPRTKFEIQLLILMADTTVMASLAVLAQTGDANEALDTLKCCASSKSVRRAASGALGRLPSVHDSPSFGEIWDRIIPAATYIPLNLAQTQPSGTTSISFVSLYNMAPNSQSKVDDQDISESEEPDPSGDQKQHEQIENDDEPSNKLIRLLHTLQEPSQISTNFMSFG